MGEDNEIDRLISVSWTLRVRCLAVPLALPCRVLRPAFRFQIRSNSDSGINDFAIVSTIWSSLCLECSPSNLRLPTNEEAQEFVMFSEVT